MLFSCGIECTRDGILEDDSVRGSTQFCFEDVMVNYGMLETIKTTVTLD